MPNNSEIAKHAAILLRMEKLPVRNNGGPGAENPTALFLHQMRHHGIEVSQLATPAGKNLITALKKHGQELITDHTGQRKILPPAGPQPSRKDAHYAEKLNAEEPGDVLRGAGRRRRADRKKKHADPRLVEYLSRLKCRGRTTAPEPVLAAALARHDLKLEERLLEGSKGNVRKWFLVEAPGEADKWAAGVGAGVEEGLGHGRNVVPAGRVGAGAGLSSGSAGESEVFRAMQDGGQTVAEMSMPHAVKPFGGVGLDVGPPSGDNGWFGGVNLDDLVDYAVDNGLLDHVDFGELGEAADNGGVGLDERSVAMQGELSSGPVAPGWPGTWSAAPVNPVASYLGEFSNSGVDAQPWGTGGSGGVASGFPLVGPSGDFPAGPLVAQYAVAGVDARSCGTGGSEGVVSAYPPVAPSSSPPPGRSAGHTR
ncbi:hypothetical protein [Streptomyces sp. NPDC006012]|uniref:hypothetical protein n=1 Tax=Streptomyces sp. NPDC006012 TaxID=3364739 RepID=UPI00369C2AB8